MSLRDTTNDVERQHEMRRYADRRILDLCKLFNEIMTGPNPLTRDEIAALVAKRPDVYGVLERWTR